MTFLHDTRSLQFQSSLSSINSSILFHLNSLVSPLSCYFHSFNLSTAWCLFLCQSFSSFIKLNFPFNFNHSFLPLTLQFCSTSTLWSLLYRVFFFHSLNLPIVWSLFLCQSYYSSINYFSLLFYLTSISRVSLISTL